MESKNIEGGVQTVLTLYAALSLKERNQVLRGFHFSVLMYDDAILEFFSEREGNVFEMFLLGSNPSTNKI